MRLGHTIAIAAAAAMLAGPAGAQDSGWSTVGRVTVGADASSGTMKVRWDPSFRQGMFCADGHAIRLTEATLRFEDGTSKVVKVRQKLTDGACSKAIAMPRKTQIATLDIAYDAATLEGGKAKLTLAAR